MLSFGVSGAAGGTGSFNFAILFFSNGDALRGFAADLLWPSWKLDCLSYQCTVC